MHIDPVEASPHESPVDLLCEVHAHHNARATATRAAVQAHPRDRVLVPQCGLHLAVATNDADAVSGLAALVLLYSLVEPGPAQRSECLRKELCKEQCVRRDARGRGVGSALMRWAAQFAITRGCGRMLWSVQAPNRRGRAFYQAWGAVRLADRLSYRLSSDALRILASAADATPPRPSRKQ